MAIDIADFDVVALKWDTGESVTDSTIGVDAVPAPVLDGAVNFMIIGGAIPLNLTAGPAGGGIVAFGWADSTAWTPADGDGLDLTNGSDDIGARVYATVDGAGNLRLLSAAPFTAGQEIASTVVTLSPDKPWRLSVDVETNSATVFYGNDIVLEAPPFGVSGAADPADVGDDFVISVLSGATETGSASLNDLGLNPQLAVESFPRVLPHRAISQRLAAPRTADILLVDERADLVVYFKNAGSSTASNVSVQLVPPPGVGITVNEPSTIAIPSLPAGGTTPRVFTIESSASTPVGVHKFTASVSGGASGSIDLWVPVWDVDVTIIDADLGLGSASGSTPFNTFSIDIDSPEVWINGEPAYFDPNSSDFTITHEAPFRGTHWGDLVFLPAARNTKALLVNGKVVMKDKDDNPVSVAGSTATLVNLDTGFTKTVSVNGAGEFSFIGVSPGAYRLVVLLPPNLRKLYGLVGSDPFEVGDDDLNLGDVAVSAPPAGAEASLLGPPPTAQGQTGTPTNGPPPPPKNPPPPAKGGTARSALVGFGVGVIADIADIFLAGGSGGLTLLSIFAGNGLGTAFGIAADPVNEDVLYIGRANTPPADPTEFTLSESVSMVVDITPPLSLSAASTITTTFTYTRTTDADTYVYASGESLPFDRYLPLAVTAESHPNGVLVTVEPTYPGGQGLPGSEVLVQGWMVAGDNDLILGAALFTDDGMGSDVTADDGIHTGVLPEECGVGMKLHVFASKSGFLPEDWPSYFGSHTADLNPASYCPADLIFTDRFESGGVVLWSNSVP